jgi:hypothetical protein
MKKNVICCLAIIIRKCHILSAYGLGAIVVSCAGDNELAKALHSFLTGKFPKLKTSLNEDEVYFEPDRQLTPSQVRISLEEFKSSDPAFHKCIVSNNKDVFVLALQVDIEQIGLYKCAWCGIILSSEAQLDSHMPSHLYSYP